jgi:hypothetical protein
MKAGKKGEAVVEGARVRDRRSRSLEAGSGGSGAWLGSSAEEIGQLVRDL